LRGTTTIQNTVSYTTRLPIFLQNGATDMEYLILGKIAKISLASKWCPSLDTSYDRSTLLCESVARKLFPHDFCPEYRELDESHYVYRVRNRLQREVLVPLRKFMLPEIYMSARQWNAMKTYKRLFYKHGLLQHLQNVQCPKSKMPKELLPHDILSLLGCESGHEVADLQWKRMIDAYFSKGKFVNCFFEKNLLLTLTSLDPFDKVRLI
jgi:hypothetical protein